MKKIIVGMICSLSSDKETPLYRDVTDKEYEEWKNEWQNMLAKVFYDDVSKILRERESEKNG